MKHLVFISFLAIASYACHSQHDVLPGAFRFDGYEALIEGKRTGLVCNHTSMVGDVHLVDTLLSRGAVITKIFAPEHGFRGTGKAGAEIQDERHPVYRTEIVSLYGEKRKPAAEDLKDIDIMLFDIQDVGARFYTYISTLQYVMEACARSGISLLVLDRPNPNGFYVDGPILDTSYASFVGMTPIPLVHGMTIGEYALMLNGEGWLEGGLQCDLQVIKCENYTHNYFYHLPVSPSPNLPDMNSVYLYPSLCLFEGTVLSCGRGTDTPFQLFGHPDMPDRGFSYTPGPNEGSSDPPFNGELCYGTDLRMAMDRGIVPAPYLQIGWIIDAYNDFPDKDNFFTSYINLLTGGKIFMEQVTSGMTEDEIRRSWQEDLDAFRRIREKYLLYD